MVEITYQMVLSTLQTIALIVGIAYYLIIMRNAQKTRELTLESQELARKAQEQALETRQAQLFMYMYDRWSDPDFLNLWNEIFLWEWTDYDDYEEKYRTEAKRVPFSSIGIFFEGIGVLVKRELIDPTLVDDLMSSMVLRFWDKFGESVIKEKQVRDDYPQYFEYVEYLYNVIKPMVESQHPELKT